MTVEKYVQKWRQFFGSDTYLSTTSYFVSAFVKQQKLAYTIPVCNT